MITLLEGNGTACPYSHHQHVEKRTIVYNRRKYVSHTLSLQQANLSTLHVNTLHIPVCEHGGAGSESEQSSMHLLSWGGQHTWETDRHQIQLAPARRPLASIQAAPRTLCREWGRLDSPHSPPDSPGFAAFSTAGGCRRDIHSLLFQCQVFQERPHISLGTYEMRLHNNYIFFLSYTGLT